MSVFAGPEVSGDGLVIALDSSNLKSYPGSGNTWFDMSGKGNHCSFNVLPTFANNIFTFDGTSHFGTITNNASLNFSAEQSVTMILRHSFTTGRRNPWNQAYGGYGTWTHETGDTMNYYYGDAGVNSVPYTAISSTATARNVWNVMTVVRDITKILWYINGVEVAYQANPYSDLTATTPNITLGNGYAGYWQGDMASVYAYTKALTPSEVKRNFNALRGRFGI